MRVIFKVKEGFFINVLFILSFFIYVRKLPIESETQPFFLFIISIFFLFLFRAKILRKDLFLVLQLIVLTLYLLVQFFFYQNGLVEYITYLIGPIVYFAFFNRVNLISTRAITAIVYLHFFIAIVLVFQIPVFYNFLNYIFELFIYRERGANISGLRGPSLLTPEPSYFAFPVILLIHLVEKKYNEDKSIKIKRMWFILAFLTIVTKSALVFFYVLIYLSGKLFSRYSRLNVKLSLKKVVLTSVAFLVLLFPFIFLKESRPVQVVDNLSNNFSNYNFEALLLKESSGSTRFIINYLGYATVLKKPMGWGIGNFKNNYNHISNKNLLQIINKHEIFRNYRNIGKPMKAQTYVANLVGDIGFFAIPIFIFLFLSFIDSRDKNNGGLRWIVLLMLVFVQGQISNPVIWILLAFLNSPDKRRESYLEKKKNNKSITNE